MNDLVKLQLYVSEEIVMRDLSEGGLEMGSQKILYWNCH